MENPDFLTESEATVLPSTTQQLDDPTPGHVHQPDSSLAERLQNTCIEQAGHSALRTTVNTEDLPAPQPGTDQAEWRHGEVRVIIQEVGKLNLPPHLHPLSILETRPALRRAYQLLIKSDLTMARISDQLGYHHQSHVSRVTRRILQELVSRIPPEDLQLNKLRQAVSDQFPPQAMRPYRPPEDSVGRRLSVLLSTKYPENKTLIVHELAQRIDKTSTSVWRFLRSQTHPSEEMLELVLDYLDLSPDEARAFRNDYRNECKAKFGRKRNQPG